MSQSILNQKETDPRQGPIMKGGEQRRKYMMMTMKMRFSGREGDLLGGLKAERDRKVERSRPKAPGPKVEPDPKVGLGPKVELEVSLQQLKCAKLAARNHLAENQLKQEVNLDRKVLGRKVVVPKIVADLQGEQHLVKSIHLVQEVLNQEGQMERTGLCETKDGVGRVLMVVVAVVMSLSISYNKKAATTNTLHSFSV